MLSPCSISRSPVSGCSGWRATASTSCSTCGRGRREGARHRRRRHARTGDRRRLPPGERILRPVRLGDLRAAAASRRHGACARSSTGASPSAVLVAAAAVRARHEHHQHLDATQPGRPGRRRSSPGQASPATSSPTAPTSSAPTPAGCCRPASTSRSPSRVARARSSWTGSTTPRPPAAASPQAFADRLEQMSEPDHVIWYVWAPGYQTYGTKCEAIEITLLADHEPRGERDLPLQDRPRTTSPWSWWSSRHRKG